jgi:hypothetical protein
MFGDESRRQVVTGVAPTVSDNRNSLDGRHSALPKLSKQVKFAGRHFGRRLLDGDDIIAHLRKPHRVPRNTLRERHENARWPLL